MNLHPNRLSTSTLGRWALSLLLLFLSSLFTSAAGGEAHSPPVLTLADTFYYQLTWKLRSDIPATVYDVDLFDTPAVEIERLKEEGKKVICYFSAGTLEVWRPDAKLFPKDAVGKPVEGWPGERWLNVNSPVVRELMLKRLELAVLKGCDGVEPDNVDLFTQNTGFSITFAQQADYNLFLAESAHRLGLLVALKNDPLQAELLSPYFDFAVVEQCYAFGECFYYLPFVRRGKPVFDVEYDKSLLVGKNFERMCNYSELLKIEMAVYPKSLNGSFVFDCRYGIFK
ncbi:endo alpha-1,4 polygalactosaminidase [Thermovibrio ammonificans]